MKGFDVEVRVLDEKSSFESAPKEDLILKDMKPFTIEESDLAPGDLSDVAEDMKLFSHSDETDLPEPPDSVMKTKEE